RSLRSGRRVVSGGTGIGKGRRGKRDKASPVPRGRPPPCAATACDRGNRHRLWVHSSLHGNERSAEWVPVGWVKVACQARRIRSGEVTSEGPGKGQEPWRGGEAAQVTA